MYQQDLSASSAPREVGVDALLGLVEELVRGQLEPDRRLVAGWRRARWGGFVCRGACLPGPALVEDP
eukprot:3278857-Lingulodinium_polyedra.AAC.1